VFVDDDLPGQVALLGERALVGIDEAAVMLGEDRSTLYRSIKPVTSRCLSHINGRMRYRERQSKP